jgi:hypothetical protein
MPDFDQGGVGANTAQGVRVYLGNSLGWAQLRAKPQRKIMTAGVYPVLADDGVLLIATVGTVQINLPDVRAWVAQVDAQPATSLERSIWIKDLQGNASASPILVIPFAGPPQQYIDLLTQFQIADNHAICRLCPLPDQSGWYVA